MARSFTAASSQYLEYAGASVTGPPFSVSCWASRASNTHDMRMFSLADVSTTTKYFALAIENDFNGRQVRAYTRSGATVTAAESSASFAASGWCHAAGVWYAADDRRAYVSGGNEGTETTSISPSPIDRTAIGRQAGSSPAQYWDGYIAEMGLWNVTLNPI